MAITLTRLYCDSSTVGVVCSNDFADSKYLTVTFGITFSSGTVSGAGPTKGEVPGNNSENKVFGATHAYGGAVQSTSAQAEYDGSGRAYNNGYTIFP